MPQKRKEDASVPTQVKWSKTYLAKLPGMVKEGRVDLESAKKLARGHRAVITAGEESLAKFRKTKREELEKGVQEANELLG